MNGVHDMGGMDGLGPIEREASEPVFHTQWERRMLAVTLAAGAWDKWNIDAGRHARERIPGPRYLASSYYEIWYQGLLTLLEETGLATAEELRSGKPAPGSVKADPPLKAEHVPITLGRGGPTSRDVTAEQRFAVGQSTRARNIHPRGHTRLPRYARGKVGVIDRVHGVHVFPDSNAHFQGEAPQMLYSVRFAAKELWGDAAASRDAVYIDMWDSYLEPV